MRTTERLRKLKEWTYNTVCKGREMKTPAPGMDISKVVRQEPKVYLGYVPTRPDLSAYAEEDPLNAAPGIILAPVGGDVRKQDTSGGNDVFHPRDMGQSLTVQAVFFVYEDGIRLPGFIDSAKTGEYDMTLLREGTEEGLYTLVNWMDDFKDALLSEGGIPETDLLVDDAEFEYGFYSERGTIADKRPMFIGMVTVKFNCHANHYNKEIYDLLN